MTDDLITPTLAAEVACAVSGQSLEQFVESIPSKSVPVYLARLVDAATNIRALTKGLEQRLVVDGQVGQHWTIDGVEYGFFGAQAKGWKDLLSLLSNIHSYGVPFEAIAGAISEIRVTDLREATAYISNEENRAAARALIEESRIPKGERGSPRFQAISDYVK